MRPRIAGFHLAKQRRRVPEDVSTSPELVFKMTWERNDCYTRKFFTFLRRKFVDKYRISNYAKSAMIYRAHHCLRQIARFVLLFLLFTQAALAVSGCMMPVSSLAKVIAAAGDSECCKMGSMNLNLCQAHCTADHQSLDTGEPPPSPEAHQVVLVIPVLEYARHSAAAFVRIEYCGEPAISIRFCSFRI